MDPVHSFLDSVSSYFDYSLPVKIATGKGLMCVMMLCITKIFLHRVMSNLCYSYQLFHTW
jgi:hypothetical protein